MIQNEWYELWFEEMEDGLIAHPGDLQGIDEYCLISGERIELWPLNVTLIVEGKRPRDYLFCVLTGWLPLSKRARRVFETCHAESAQFLPIRVVHKSGVELPDYALLNVLNIIPALDRENTIWLTKARDQIEYPQLNILKVALKHSALIGVDIFRLKESPTEVYISRRLKECLESAGATVGFKFLPARVF